MTPEQINIAVAEVDGWKLVRGPCQSKDDPTPRYWLPPNSTDYWTARQRCPDFYRNGDAIRRVIAKIPEQDRARFENILLEWDRPMLTPLVYILAPAPLLCRAVLEFYGKWKN